MHKIRTEKPKRIELQRINEAENFDIWMVVEPKQVLNNLLNTVIQWTSDSPWIVQHTGD